MRLSSRERLLAEFGVVVVVGAAVGALGVLSPADASLSARLLQGLAGAAIAWGVVRLLAVVGAAMARLVGVNAIWGYAFAIPLGSALLAWAVLWLAGGLPAALGEGFTRIWPRSLLIGLGFFALFFALYWRAGRANARFETPQGDAVATGALAETKGAIDTALHNSLPASFPPILAVSVEDHYVRVIAEDQSHLVLMPLRDAIALLPPDEGMQVHRSWWVARSAVCAHHRKGRDLRLSLSNGMDVPVSRAMTGPLREAGWL